MTAFYLPLGDHRYEPTIATESPWDPAMQHGGPPSALLAHAMDPGGDLRLARIAVDFLGPIPRRPLSVEVDLVKPGRLTQLIEARMVVDGRTAVVARGWHIQAGPKPDATTAPEPPPALPPPPAASQMPDFGYSRAIEWRYGRYERGHADVWTRVLHPLIAGEAMTGVARTLIVADAANGISAVLDLDAWMSIPPGLTVHLVRPADGEWVHLDCRSRLSADGLGVTSGALSDAAGRIGEVTQPLLVRKR